MAEAVLRWMGLLRLDESLVSWEERRRVRGIVSVDDSREYARRELPPMRRQFREHNLRCFRLLMQRLVDVSDVYASEMLSDARNEGLVLTECWDEYRWIRDRAIESNALMQDLFRVLDHLAERAHTAPPGGTFEIDEGIEGDLREHEVADLADEMGIRMVSARRAKFVGLDAPRALWVARVVFCR